uniref:Uncharacterized protein n=1 Tax=Anopheles maculatus TaxID=74869 RepID=A0A182T0X9_9DIPT
PTERTFRGGGNSNGRKSAANGKASARKQPNEVDDEEDEDEEEDGEEEEEEEEEEDDDEGSDFDVENEFNDGLDELLQKAQATKSSPVAGSTSVPIASSQAAGTAKSASTSGLVIETITSGNGTTITATGATSTSIPSTTTTTGKISVVPTNLLMKQPSTAASSMNAPIQIYTQPTVSIAKGPGTTTTMVASTGGSGSVGTAPVKLLLVNTVAKDGTTQQILTPASEATMPKLIPAPVYHHSKLPLTVGGGQSPIVTIPTVNVPKQVGASIKLGQPTGARPAAGLAGQSGGFRTLLTQLVAIQRENLALNQERL